MKRSNISPIKSNILYVQCRVNADVFTLRRVSTDVFVLGRVSADDRVEFMPIFNIELPPTSRDELMYGCLFGRGV